MAVEGGAVSLSERGGIFAETATTVSGEEPHCFEDVPEGDYNISVAVPDGYNPTTRLNLAEEIVSGDEKTLNFGAQLSSQAAFDNPPVEEGGRSPLLGVIGFALLLVGIGLGIFSTHIGKSKPV